MRDIEHCCRSLIRIENDTPHLIHQTARLFLHNYIEGAHLKESCTISIHQAEAEAHPATICMIVLLQDSFLRHLGELMPVEGPLTKDNRKSLKTVPAFCWNLAPN